ncbi:MAG: sugar phosphate isomerase/epimerase [Bacteroidota bacterium]
MRLKVMLVVIFLTSMSLVGQEIGIQLYSLRNQFKEDVPGTLAKIKDWGITKVEDGNDGTHGLSLEAYKALLKKNNLDMVSVSTSFEEVRDSPETVLQRAKDYGAKYVVCFWVPHTGTDFTIEDTQLALDVFNKAGKKFKEEGVTMAYHPHGYEFRPYEDTTLMDYMIKNAENFDFEMDVYWFALPGEDPIAWLRKYPEKFKLMHLKDCKKGVPVDHTGVSDVENNVVLGTGQIHMAEIILEAKKMGLQYLFIEDESSRVVEQVPQSLEFIKSLE